MQQSTTINIFFGGGGGGGGGGEWYLLLQEICFNFTISKCRVLQEEQIIKPQRNKKETRLCFV